MPKSIEITASALVKRYGSLVPNVAVDHVDLTITPGAAIGIVGESGSGKSTLARMLVGLTKPSSGQIFVNGTELPKVLSNSRTAREFRAAVQYIQQDTMSFNPRRTLRNSLRVPAKRLLGLSPRAADERIDTVLNMVGIDPLLADRYPTAVSGGQRQRFAIARAMVVEPSLLICDEVVSALDVSVQGSVLNQLKNYCRTTGAAIVFVSHGVPATCFISDELIVMNKGRIVERGETMRVLDEAADEYTRRLLAAYRKTEQPHNKPQHLAEMHIACAERA